MSFQLQMQGKVLLLLLTTCPFSSIITLKLTLCVTILGENNAEAPEATISTDSSEVKPPKSDKTKKTVPDKGSSPKAKVQANGVAVKTAAKSKGKKDLPTGSKKAKVAKLDGETVKGTEAKKPIIKTADETKKKASEIDKKEGGLLTKKQVKKTKNPMKAKNRMGKNKFRKLKHMLQKNDGK